MVNKALQSYLDRFTIIYMDDILIYLNIKNEYIKYVKMVLDVLKRKKSKIKPKNAGFMSRK